MVDSDAPEQIALDLGRRHALYLREAQRLVVDGLVPDEAGLADGIRAETARYLQLAPVARSPHPRAGGRRSRGARARGAEEIVGRRSGSRATPASAPPRPVRRLALQPSATIVGNMAVRKRPTAEGLELSWDSAPNVTEWTIRVSVRPDPRQDYVEGDAVALPAASSSYEVALDERPAADPALRPRPRRPHRSSRRRLGPDERQQRLAVEAAGDRELMA